MPPAIHEQPSPRAAPRSITSTARPRSLSSSAAARPATPAPMTVTLDRLTAGLPFLRRHDPDQVQRVQPQWLSQTGFKPDTPRTSAEGDCRPPLLSSQVRRLSEALAVGLAHQPLVVLHQRARHRSNLIAAIVDRADRHDLGGGAAQEDLARLVEFVGHHRTLLDRPAAPAGHAHHGAAGDAVEEVL